MLDSFKIQNLSFKIKDTKLPELDSITQLFSRTYLQRSLLTSKSGKIVLKSSLTVKGREKGLRDFLYIKS